jgi:hypothetical protein
LILPSKLTHPRRSISARKHQKKDRDKKRDNDGQDDPIQGLPILDIGFNPGLVKINQFLRILHHAINS